MFRLIFNVFRAPPFNPFIVIPFLNSSILKTSIKSVRRLKSFNPKRLIKNRKSKYYIRVLNGNDEVAEVISKVESNFFTK